MLLGILASHSCAVGLYIELLHKRRLKRELFLERIYSSSIFELATIRENESV